MSDANRVLVAIVFGFIMYTTLKGNLRGYIQILGLQ